MESVNHVSDYVNKTLKFVNSNKIMNSVVAIFLILYAVLAAPKLPKSVAKVFDYTLVKLGYMFLIAYLATKNPSVAIISAATLLITIQTLSSYDTADKIVDAVQSNNVVAVETRSDVPLSPARAELVEESTKKALLYTSLGNLGNQIATGIGGTPEQWRQMYNLPTVYNDTLRSFPQATITPSATSAIGQRNYFG
jgi:hypothetical protein